jgi:hypothetical protein
VLLDASNSRQVAYFLEPRLMEVAAREVTFLQIDTRDTQEVYRWLAKDLQPPLLDRF